jgi:UDP-glucuronate decarboxylase
LHDVSKPFPLEEKPDYILHAAGIASPMYYRRFPLETIDVATTGTRSMLELARKSRSLGLVYFSSSEIYGDPDPGHVPTSEDYNGNVSSIGPRACYDESKRLGETFCSVYHKQFGTRVMIVRPFNVYGPGMKEADYRVLPNFANSIKAGKALTVYGTGLQTRTFCFVEDAIVGFLQVLLSGRSGEAYNIGNPSPEISMRGLVDLITKISPRPVKSEFIPYPESYPAGEPMRRCPDIAKAAKDVGFAPGVDLEQGLRAFLDWTDHAYTGMDL